MCISRRSFLTEKVSCAAHIALAAAAMPLTSKKLWAAEPLGKVVAREPFGTLEEVAEGVWAHISTPLTGSRTTIANGGLIAGRDGVLAVEGFIGPDGAQWLAGMSRELTGKWPTHVAITHYHGDHANGVAGYLNESNRPEIRSTERTRDLVIERQRTPDEARVAALEDAILLPTTERTEIDLGGRTVHLVPRGGHTDSDVTVELDDPNVVFCGDLVWNAMFPNYVDTVPTKMVESVRALMRVQDTVYVPGHGPLSKSTDLNLYIAMLEEVERSARSAHAEGIEATDAGSNFSLPSSLGEWALFNPSSTVFYDRAFAAWYAELES